MPDSPSGEERTEPATPRKRQKEREEGQVAKSREVGSAVVLLLSLLALLALGPSLGRRLMGLIQEFMIRAGGGTQNEHGGTGILYASAYEFMKAVLPFFLVMIVAGFAGNLLQVGFLCSFKAMAPKANRISPIAGFKRIFGWKGMVEVLKGFAKLLVLGFLCYNLLKQEIPRIAALSESSVAGIFGITAQLGTQLFIRSLIFILIVAALDYGFQRWQYEQQIKMTITELKQELKQYDGDPLIKARIKSIQRELARQRMMAEVPEADVVITNPTHYAVAIRYDAETMAAPRVVAKGRDAIAARIREIAKENHIPIVEEPPLARALYAAAEIGDFVPENLFQAVAEILAYVYQAQGRLREKLGAAV